MASNIIDLSHKLMTRNDDRALTVKQRVSVELVNYKNEGRRLIRAIQFHKSSHNKHLQELKEVLESIENAEKRLMET